MTLNRRIALGAAWMIGLRLIYRLIGIISMIILARLLVPEDFGLVAMATALMALVVLFSELSVDTALVQKTDVDASDLDSAWSLQVMLAVCQAAAMAALAQPIANFYDKPELRPVIYVLSLALLIQGFRNIGTVAFQRDMTFHKEFVLRCSQKLVSFTATVTIAILFRSHWALVTGILAGKTAETMLSYGMHPYRPRWSREKWGALFAFSKWLLLNNGLLFLAQKGPIFILGKLSNAQGVGAFTIAYEIAMLPHAELVAPINKAVLPGYSKMKQSRTQLQQGYIDVIGMITLIALPAALGLAATADVLIPLLLGQNWLATVPLVEVLALGAAVSTLQTNTGTVFLALGHPHILSRLVAIWVAVLVPSMITGGILAGPYGLACAIVLVTAAMLPVNVATVLYVLRLSPWRLLAAVIRPCLAGCLMYAILDLYLAPSITQALGAATVLSALTTVAGGAVVYSGLVGVLWLVAKGPAGAETHFGNFCRDRLLGRTARQAAE